MRNTRWTNGGNKTLSFSDFNLNKDFIQAIEAAGYSSPTDLQAQLIPIVEQKKSALILSQSASGKTGAFLIPAMNYILENPAPEKRGARVLILTSRRDRVRKSGWEYFKASRRIVLCNHVCFWRRWNNPVCRSAFPWCG